MQSVVCFVCFCTLSCVPYVVSFSGLSIFDLLTSNTYTQCSLFYDENSTQHPLRNIVFLNIKKN
jgi:hypothetical protein